MTYVDPEFFRFVGAQMVTGQAFERGNSGPATAAVGNTEAAALLTTAFGAIPMSLRRTGANSQMIPLIGVVRDDRYDAGKDVPRLYLPRATLGRSPQSADVLVRIHGDPNVNARALTDFLLKSPGIALVSAPVSIRTLAREKAAGVRSAERLVGGLAVAAILLACLGMYTATSISIQQRRRALALRSALGARPMQIAALAARGSVACSARWPRDRCVHNTGDQAATMDRCRDS